jgi:hypothetical protein
MNNISETNNSIVKLKKTESSIKRSIIHNILLYLVLLFVVLTLIAPKPIKLDDPMTDHPDPVLKSKRGFGGSDKSTP